MGGLREINNTKEGSPGAKKKTLMLLGLFMALIFISLITVGAFIIYPKISKSGESSDNEQVLPETMPTSTTTSSTTTSSTTSTTSTSLTTSTSSTSTTSTSILPTPNSTQSGLYCHGEKVPEDWLTGEGKSVPNGMVRAVLCIEGFSQPRSYANKMERIRHARGVIRASITYRYPIGYVVYDPNETNMDEISSILGDYSIDIIKDGIK